MLIQHNYLKSYRKQSGLAQSDIAALLNLPHRTSVARYERGLRKSTIDILLLYHILFVIPIEAIFERQKYEVLASLGERLRDRIGQIKQLKQTPTVAVRVAFLEGALERLAVKQN